MPVNFLLRFNLFLAPIAALILILIDIQNKKSVDRTMPWIMTAMIAFTLASMASELCYQLIVGLGGEPARALCWVINTFFFLFQNLAFCCMPLFLDYSARTDQIRLKRLGFIVASICVFDFIMLTINLFTGFIFSITPDSMFAMGPAYWAQLCVSYSFFVIVLINTGLSRIHMERSKIVLVLIATLPVAAGALLDILLSDVYFAMPSFFISLLFCYLFMSRMSMLFDSLTGVYNRRGIDEYLLELTRTTRRRAYSFIMIDMDRFKEINDVYGHAQGDVALRDTAVILRSSVRRTDLVARYGGDEFVIIAATEETDRVIENIFKSIADFNELGIRAFTLRLSCGGGLYLPDETRTPQEFLSYVDGLMYAEKTERRRADESEAADAPKAAPDPTFN